MIAFDEIALLLEPAGPELQHWLDMYRPTRDWSAWLPPPNARHVRSDRMEFNKLVVPTGAQRWSFMVGLAANRRLREITDRLGLTTGNSPSRDYLPKILEFGQYEAGTLPFNYSRIMAYMLQPRPVTFSWRQYGRHDQLDKDPYRDLYAIPIVDERWAWQFIYVDESDYDNATIDNLDDQVRHVWSVLAKTNDQLKILVNTPAASGAWDDLSNLPVCDIEGFQTQSAAQILDQLTEPLGMRLVPSVSDPGAYYLLSGPASAEIHRRSMDQNDRFRIDPDDATQYRFMADDPIPIVCGGSFADMPTTPRDLSAGGWLPAVPTRASVAFNDGSVELSAEDLGYVGIEYRVHAPLASDDAAYRELALSGAVEHLKHGYDWTFAGHRPHQLTSLDSVAVYSYEHCAHADQYTGVSRLVSRLPNDQQLPVVGGGSSSGTLTLGMVSCYLGNGWYDVYKVDLEPPKIAAEDVLDETTGQTRIVQLHAGRTTWLLDDKDTNQWTNESSDGYGTSQTPNVGDYEGIENGDRVVTENQLTAGQNMGLCVPLCYASTCVWTWTEDGGGVGVDDWVVSPTENCEVEAGGDDPNSPGTYVHGGCDCVKPSGSGTDYGDTLVTACAASDCSTESPPDATWTWKLDPPTNHFGTFAPYWELTTDCGDAGGDDAACRAVQPNIDTSGLADGATSTVQCYPSGLCSWVTENYDPPDPCCLIDDLSVDPDLIPRQKPYTNPSSNVSPNTYGDPVRAFSIDKMTQPGSYDLTVNPGTYCFMMPLKTGQFAPSDEVDSETHWGIVQWQRELIGAYIPTAITCCDDGSILISSYSSMIVEGIPCAGRTEQC